jgi:predicted protein tyrosine phosphatase
MAIPRNKMAVIKNPYQGNPLKVLTVCSGGVLRSPTAAALLTRDPFCFNTRSCGTEDYALIPLTEELVQWADVIVCAEENHGWKVIDLCNKTYLKDEPRPELHVLGIPDDFDYMHADLVKMMQARFAEIFANHQPKMEGNCW